MTITVRLPDKLEAELRHRLAGADMGLSEFIRAAIVEKLAREPVRRPSAYELGKHLFGRYGDGHPDGSEQRKQRAREVVDAKHHRR